MAIREQESRHEHLLSVAKAMMTAARTAPKAKGTDNLEIITICDRAEMEAIAARMNEIGASETGRTFFGRDAANLLQSEAVVIIGTRTSVLGLNCGYCGFDTCAAKGENPNVPCAFNMNDLGIAIGSATATAADHRMDSRVMWSVARAAMQLGYIECHAAFAVLISCTGKSPFFDRK